MATAAHYDIFRDQLALRYPALGHALWDPSPENPYQVVGVGDVGYITKGRFRRLFNILLPADDPSHDTYVLHFGTLDPADPNLPPRSFAAALEIMKDLHPILLSSAFRSTPSAFISDCIFVSSAAIVVSDS
ncbi:hypothetical protein EDB85DRAFT_2252742 [Lactarius pseudohatsudake]|nr:hypothetical protein EDB85DRAFT_2252742 [Lactarius pseudohatsudake]